MKLKKIDGEWEREWDSVAEFCWGLQNVTLFSIMDEVKEAKENVSMAKLAEVATLLSIVV